MAKQWEECTPDVTPGRWSRFYVTMNPQGELVMSRYTFEKIASPERCRLLFDRLNNTIGVKPEQMAETPAFRVRPQGKYGGRAISAMPLCQQFGIVLSGTVRFLRPEIDADGVLNLDLRHTTPIGRSKR